jgi:crotonobetainyl-CoA:carnitine CoA-transferase CaiB-like acyl-CoA transferase
MSAPAGHQPLARLRMVEVSTFVAAPLSSTALTQLLAEVVRVDPLGGAADHTRWPLSWSCMRLCWTGLNKARRSVVILSAGLGLDQMRATFCASAASSSPRRVSRRMASLQAAHSHRGRRV